MNAKDRTRAEAERLSDLDRALDVLRAERDSAQGELFGQVPSEWAAENTAWTTDLPIPPEAESTAPAPEGYQDTLPSAASPPSAPSAPPALAEDLDARFETVEDARIPEGQNYFKIGEVAKIVGVKPYVLRYWESEFPWVKPEKTSSRQRRYRRQDVAILLTIRRLRHDEELTIARTRELIQEMKKGGRRRPAKAKRATGLGLLPDPTNSGIDPARLRRRLADMRQAVLELLHAVED